MRRPSPTTPHPRSSFSVRGRTRRPGVPGHAAHAFARGIHRPGRQASASERTNRFAGTVVPLARNEGLDVVDRMEIGGWGRNRTGIDGFAGRCITTLPPSLGGYVGRGDPVFRVRRWSGKRDSNSRPQPWQGCALPLSYSRRPVHCKRACGSVKLNRNHLAVFDAARAAGIRPRPPMRACLTSGLAAPLMPGRGARRASLRYRDHGWGRSRITVCQRASRSSRRLAEAPSDSLSRAISVVSVAIV